MCVYSILKSKWDIFINRQADATATFKNKRQDAAFIEPQYDQLGNLTQNECYLDGGAYSSFGIATVYYAGSLLGGPYKLPNMK
ncbi:MAG: hypothetical protein GY749_06185 [Desulfobacteraceae bacterium]|nr:hypothetical protein [Desulfobacteraceae bacterium]